MDPSAPGVHVKGPHQNWLSLQHKVINFAHRAVRVRWLDLRGETLFFLLVEDSDIPKSKVSSSAIVLFLCFSILQHVFSPSYANLAFSKLIHHSIMQKIMCPFTEGKALHMSQLFSLEVAVGRHEEVEAGWIYKTKGWREECAHNVG